MHVLYKINSATFYLESHKLYHVLFNRLKKFSFQCLVPIELSEFSLMDFDEMFMMNQDFEDSNTGTVVRHDELLSKHLDSCTDFKTKWLTSGGFFSNQNRRTCA